MARIIKKVSFKAAGEKGVKIAYNTHDENGKQGEGDINLKNTPAGSFVTALQNLKTHMLFITDFMDAEKFKKFIRLDEDDVVGKSFRVCGVSISGEDEKEGIIITGYHTLKNGLGYVFNTPLTKIQNEGETAYKFIQELEEDIEVIRKEATDYMAGKYGAVQTKMEFESNGEEVVAEESN